jgi:hypothetical protein
MPHPRKASAPCPICRQRGGKKTKEDVWPVWLRLELERLGGRRPDRVIYYVCGICQARLSKHFETPAAPILKPMLAGLAVQLSPDQQLIVARWIVKTQLLLLAKDAERPVIAPTPRLDRRDHALRLVRQVIADLAPPPGCLIRLGRHDRSLPKDPTPMEDRTYIPTREFPRLDAAGSCISGALYWQCFLGRPDRLFSVVEATRSDDWYCQTWPQQPRSVQWPPPRTFSLFDFTLMAELMKHTRPPGTQTAVAEPPALA